MRWWSTFSFTIFAWSESFCLFAAPDDDPPEQKNNLLLHEAVRALFACSPLFHTQTLTLEAFPVPDACCSSTGQDADVSTTTLTHADTADGQETLSLLHPSRTNSRKRPKEMLPARERKRRKSSSWCENVLCIHGTTWVFNHFLFLLVVYSLTLNWRCTVWYVLRNVEKCSCVLIKMFFKKNKLCCSQFNY